MSQLDFLIVGQGLAGSVLAFQLMEQNQKVLVLDQEPNTSSSKVAAGLCNPIVFKRLNKSWLLDEIMDVAKNFYRHQEQLLGASLFKEMPIYKLFTSEEEQGFWKQKSNEPHLFDWVNPTIQHPFGEYVKHPYGAAHVLQSGFLHTQQWLNLFKSYLIERNSYTCTTVNYADLTLLEDGVQWGEYRAKKVIFCEGYRGQNNPYFDWLPFKLTKGETLTVKFKNLTLDAAINKGAFVLPYGQHYKVGATYDWDNLDETPTEEGKQELLDKISRFISDDVEVLDHMAGIRPTVKDRRPLIGVHPEHTQLAMFNGMGTKGVMYAPHLANKLVALLLKNEPLPDEMDINRFQTS